MPPAFSRFRASPLLLGASIIMPANTCIDSYVRRIECCIQTFRGLGSRRPHYGTQTPAAWTKLYQIPVSPVSLVDPYVSRIECCKNPFRGPGTWLPPNGTQYPAAWTQLYQIPVSPVSLQGFRCLLVVQAGSGRPD